MDILLKIHRSYVKKAEDWKFEFDLLNMLNVIMHCLLLDMSKSIAYINMHWQFKGGNEITERHAERKMI